MKIHGLEIFEFSIPLATPLVVGGMEMTERRGLILCLADGLGRVGCGEVSPLPGWDQTTLDDCLMELSRLVDELKGCPLDLDSFDLTKPLLGMNRSKWNFTNHVLFGLESALLWLYLQAVPSSRERFKNNDILVNGLFIPDKNPGKVEASIDRLAVSGFSVVKVKIGRLPMEQEVGQIHRLCSRFQDRLTLRLDPNQSLGFDQYRAFHDALSDRDVEYVEEPLQGGDLETASRVPWALALDESLSGFSGNWERGRLETPKGTGAIIVKPGLFSGLHGLFQAAFHLADHGIKTVLSSAFNTGAGLCSLGLASRFLPLSCAHGLDTLKYLQDDVLKTPPRISNGNLDIPASVFQGAMEWNGIVLTRVYS